MNHCDKKFSFENVKPFDTHLVDYDWAKSPKDLDNLMRFARSMYVCDRETWDYEEYIKMMAETIKYNNIEGLSLLWEAIYYHDRDSPNYEHWLEEASKYGNLKMFQYCLYGYGNYIGINGTMPVTYSSLVQNAMQNKDKNVLTYLKRLEPCVIDGELKPMANNDEFIKDFLNNEDSYEFSKEQTEAHKLYFTLSQYCA